MTVGDLNHGKRSVRLPSWIDGVGVTVRRVYERSTSVSGLLGDVAEDVSGVAPPRRGAALQRRVALFAVTLPLCRVLAVFGAFLVPGRLLRYVFVGLIDALSVFAAADALIAAIAVCALDLPELFVHLVHDSLPAFLHDAFRFHMRLDGTNAAVVAGIVAFEELFLRLVARPALARAQRRDWPLDERSALVASQAALAS